MRTMSAFSSVTSPFSKNPATYRRTRLSPCVLHGVEVCCSVLQCVVGYCSALQFVAVWCSVLAPYLGVLQCVAVFSSVLQCVTLLQCINHISRVCVCVCARAHGVCVRDPLSLRAQNIGRQKSPVFYQKSPTFHQQTPIFHPKSNLQSKEAYIRWKESHAPSKEPCIRATHTPYPTTCPFFLNMMPGNSLHKKSPIFRGKRTTTDQYQKSPEF